MNVKPTNGEGTVDDGRSFEDAKRYENEEQLHSIPICASLWTDHASLKHTCEQKNEGGKSS